MAVSDVLALTVPALLAGVGLYGVLTGRIEEAQAFFGGQAQIIETLSGFPNTEKTVAFFYLHSNGAAVVPP